MGRKRVEKEIVYVQQTQEQEDAGDRDVRVAILEHKMPYDKNVYVTDIKVRLNRTAEDMLAVGKILLVIQEKEGHGSFQAIIDEEIGIPLRTAYRFMSVALKHDKFPTLKIDKLKKSTVYALLEAPDEDLKELEEKGVLAGRDMDDIVRMSVQEVRDMARKLSKEKESIVRQSVKEETAHLQNQLELLSKENHNLKSQLPDMATVESYIEQIERFSKHVEACTPIIRLFSNIPKDSGADDPLIMCKVEELIKKIKLNTRLIASEWNEYCDNAMGYED